MNLEEKPDQVLIRGDIGIIDYLHRLGVAAAVGADLFVSGVFFVAADVSCGRRDDTLCLLEVVFSPPEAATSEDGSLGMPCSFVQRRGRIHDQFLYSPFPGTKAKETEFTQWRMFFGVSPSPVKTWPR